MEVCAEESIFEVTISDSSERHPSTWRRANILRPLGHRATPAVAVSPGDMKVSVLWLWRLVLGFPLV
jgi:hypothetical protein